MMAQRPGNRLQAVMPAIIRNRFNAAASPVFARESGAAPGHDRYRKYQ
jgi:hypothetical protein